MLQSECSFVVYARCIFDQRVLTFTIPYNSFSINQGEASRRGGDREETSRGGGRVSNTFLLFVLTYI